MKSIIIVYKDIKMGGASLLLARMAKWYANEEKDIIVICNSITKNMKEQLNINGIKIIECISWNKREFIKEIKDIGERGSVKIFHFTFEEFLWIESENLKLCNDFKVINLLYVVHPKILFRIDAIKNKMLKFILWKYYRELIFKYINNGNIFFMDEETLDSTREFYRLTLKDNNLIYRLPINIEEYNSDNICERANNKDEEFTILTIARADFPFKGYILGLIDQFEDMKLRYPHIKLIIISSGKDEKIIQEYIHNKDNIVLIGEVNHSEIRKYMSKSHIFVGMGTSILDAANNSVIALPVLFDTYEAKASNFFNEKPERITAIHKNSENVSVFIEKIINTDTNGYCELCKYNKEAVDNYYNINTILWEIHNKKNVDSKRVMNILERSLEKSIYSIKKSLKVGRN